MSRSATPATRNEATRRLKPPKTTPSAELTIGTAKALTRTVANGCGRLRTVADGSATLSEHTLNPQTPRVKREPLLCIREKLFSQCCRASWSRRKTCKRIWRGPARTNHTTNQYKSYMPELMANKYFINCNCYNQGMLGRMQMHQIYPNLNHCPSHSTLDGPGRHLLGQFENA